MKRTLILFSLALFVAGCEEPAGRTENSGAVYVRQYNGHQYLYFLLGPYGAGGVVHDPDCPCHSKTLTEWQQLQLAIAITESRCNPSATGKTQDFGILQLRPVYVKEANRLAGTDYTHEDSYDIGKSLAMFRIIQDHYNPERSIDRAIRLHNPGGNAVNYAHKVQSNILFIQRLEAARKAILEQEL